jgi:hypothetical protein
MKRREAAWKSEARSADFLDEILSLWILETEIFGGTMAFRNTKTLAYTSRKTGRPFFIV